MTNAELTAAILQACQIIEQKYAEGDMVISSRLASGQIPASLAADYRENCSGLMKAVEKIRNYVMRAGDSLEEQAELRRYLDMLESVQVPTFDNTEH